MELVPYFIHPEVLKAVEFLNLDLFNMDNYVFDDIHENHNYLQSLDPRDWKDQDHYAVLRLKKVRINASPELIKQAYRKQLLDHHPDKGRQRLKKCDDENNDYFTCITMAFDLLKDDVTRKSYDSVDPEFDDTIPLLRDVKESFYKTLGPVFQRNSRWSTIQPVPFLGDDNTDINEVHRFYIFWDDFRSWREFSYLDEESKANAENREERRYIDKLNKAERKKKSQDECKRINSLVELAKTNDPRIIKYNTERKAAKEAEKKAKADRKMEVKLAAEKALREEKEKLEREEAEKQQKLKDEANNLKKEKEIVKNKQKAEKRKLRKICETHNYFCESLVNLHQKAMSAEMCKAEMMNIIEGICAKISLDDIVQLNEQLERSSEQEMVSLINAVHEKMICKSSDSTKQNTQKSNSVGMEITGHINKCGDREWTFELSQFLIKSINTHPSGTKHRWNVIAEHMNMHHPGLNVKEKQVIQKAKLLQSDDSVLKKEAAAHNLVTKADLMVEDNLKNVQITNRTEERVARNPWSLDEQKQLEIALKTIPSSDPARWDKISEFVKTRSKKECMLRFKECAEKMKAKKAAQ